MRLLQRPVLTQQEQLEFAWKERMYSCSSLGVKIGGGIGTAAVGWLLAVGGFVNDAAVQTAGATNMILWIYLIIPVLIGVLITYLLSRLDVEKANQKWDEEHQNV